MSERVTVLMPVFKTDYFESTLASVLAQGHADLEILVGDNAGDRGAREIVERLGDPRVTYLPNHRVSAGSPRINHLVLWERATSRYVRFVYDDDLIDPESTGTLLSLHASVPNCAMAWHQRRFIDSSGAPTGIRDFLGDLGTVVMNRPLVLDNLVRFDNFIGEPSFVMFDRAVMPEFRFNRHRGHDLVHAWDIAMYLHATDCGLAAGSAKVLGSFRQHGGQLSAGMGQRICIVEWELILREELAAGTLDPPLLERFLQKVFHFYACFEPGFAPLGEFAARLRADMRGDASQGILAGREAFIAAYRALAGCAHPGAACVPPIPAG